MHWFNDKISPSRAVRASLFATLAFSFIPLTGPASQTVPSNYYPDNSDWWSELRASDVEESAGMQEREISEKNFRILGIDLTDGMFAAAATKLGKTQILQRGDASSGRSQACFVSNQGSRKVFLIFEQGEVNFAFYVFLDTRPWNGMDRCTPSSSVSANLTTASGLHLGQSPVEVKAILGEPSASRSNELIYALHVQKKTSAEDFDRARANNPNMTDADLHANFDFYDLGVGIVAKFTNGKLTFFSISKSETT